MVLVERATCSFCGERRTKTGELAGVETKALGVCAACAGLAVAEVDNARARNRNPWQGDLHHACSFCGAGEDETTWLIAGPKDYICEACARAAERVLGAAG